MWDFIQNTVPMLINDAAKSHNNQIENIFTTKSWKGTRAPVISTSAVHSKHLGHAVQP